MLIMYVLEYVKLCACMKTLYMWTHILHIGNQRDRNRDTNVNVLMLASHYCSTDGSTGVQAKPFYLLSDYWYIREQYERKQTLQKWVQIQWSFFILRENMVVYGQIFLTAVSEKYTSFN